MNAIGLNKNQALHTDHRAIKQIDFTENLDPAGNTTIFFILQEAIKTIMKFSKGTVRVLWMCCTII